jgi:hypothetical protein
MMSEQDVRLFAEHALIPPPKTESKDISTRQHRVVIDSRDRDMIKYPDPSNYVIDINHDIRDVLSVQLVAYDIPFNNINVTEDNNLFEYLDANGGLQTIEIPEGEYNDVTLTEKINLGFRATLNSLLGGYDPLSIPTSNIQLELNATHVTRFLFASDTGYRHRSIAKTLGFEPVDITASGWTTAKYKYHLEAERYVALFLQAAKLCQTTNPGTHECFAMIPRYVDSEGAQALDTFVRKRFAAPIAALDKIHVRFKTRGGSYYNFENKDHRLELVYTCYRQPKNYNAIFANS